jgi:2'-5' RNA ligase
MFLTSVPEIEELRFEFNPVQAQLIPPHVTLCREDEINDWCSLERRIKEVLPVQITLGFGCPIRDGNLVLLPAVSGTEDFDELRNRLLGSHLMEPRKQSPHITLIHPRNGVCTDAIYAQIVRRIQPFSWTFRHISLIEQTAGGPWLRIAHLGAIQKSQDS